MDLKIEKEKNPEMNASNTKNKKNQCWTNNYAKSMSVCTHSTHTKGTIGLVWRLKLCKPNDQSLNPSNG